jgi:hypothetical protein
VRFYRQLHAREGRDPELDVVHLERHQRPDVVHLERHQRPDVVHRDSRQPPLQERLSRDRGVASASPTFRTSTSRWSWRGVRR